MYSNIWELREGLKIQKNCGIYLVHILILTTEVLMVHITDGSDY